MTPPKELKILWILIFAYLAFFIIFTCFQHYNFHTQTWDMGIFSQTFWNTIHGQVMQNSIEETSNHLGVHMSPWLFLLIPGYALFQSPYFLLIIQTIALALGALPLYFLAQKVLNKKWWPLIISVGYLLYPSLHWINIFDFHSISFLAPLLLAAFYFIETKNWKWAAIFLILSATTKEDAILIVAFVGIYLIVKSYLLKRKADNPLSGAMERKFGWLTLIISLIYFIIATKIIMPSLGGGLLRMDRYQHLGNNFTEIFKNLFLQPELFITTIFSAAKLRYLLWLFLPVAFLPLFSGPALILLTPGLAENLLTKFSSQFSGFYQYDAVLIAGIFLATVYGLKNILDKWPGKQSLIKWTLIVAIFAGYFIHSPINPVSFPIGVFRSNPRAEAFHKIMRIIPADISIAAHTNIVPHLTNRKYINMLGAETFSADIVIIDVADNFGFSDDRAFQNYFDSYMNSGQYNLSEIDGRFLLLSKKDIRL